MIVQTSDNLLPEPVASDPPVACTLSADERPERLARWQAVAALAEASEALVDGIRLTLPPDADLGQIALLCRAERECCAFFRFALTIDARGSALEVRAPAEAAPLVHSMLRILPTEPGVDRFAP